MKKLKVAFVGHQKFHNSWSGTTEHNRLRWHWIPAILDELRSYTGSIIIGMNLGVDMILLNRIAACRETHPFRIRCVYAFGDQCENWTLHWRKEKLDALTKIGRGNVDSDFLKLTASTDYKLDYETRNRRLVDCANMLVAIWDGRKFGNTAHTVYYASRYTRKPVITINPYQKRMEPVDFRAGNTCSISAMAENLANGPTNPAESLNITKNYGETE